MTQNETPAPFMPFLPATPPVHPQQPVDVTTVVVPSKSKKSSAKKKKAAQAPPETAPQRKNRNDPEGGIPGRALALEPTPKRRKATTAKRAPKYDLQTILRVASTLKEPDQKLFEKLLGELSAMPKASRERIMKALGEVFG